MNISIKNVREEDWRLIKSEAAKRKLKIGEFINEMALGYKREKDSGNWKEILYGKKFLTEKDSVKIKETMKDLRKEFEFR